MALIGLCIGCYTFLDGQAIRRWSHPLDYLVWVTLLSAAASAIEPNCMAHSTSA